MRERDLVDFRSVLFQIKLISSKGRGRGRGGKTASKANKTPRNQDVTETNDLALG